MRLARLTVCACLMSIPVLQAIEPSEAAQLVCIKRIYVDKLDGDETAVQMRHMLISALLQTHLFAVTENEERADAVLRGSSEDLVFNEQHSSSEGVNGSVHASDSSTAYRGGGGSKSVGASLGQTESSHSDERHHEASAAVWLATKDGDVVWSTTQESQGAKFKGSMADVAERIMRKLSEDVAKARSAISVRPAPKPASPLPQK